MTIQWTPKMDALLGTMTDQEVAARLGLTGPTIGRRRHELGILPYGKYAQILEWLPEMDALLGTASNRDVAEQLGMCPRSVCNRIHELGIPPFGSNVPIRWTYEMDSLIGTMYNWEVAALLGVSDSSVNKRRESLGISPFGGHGHVRYVQVRWTGEMDALLGTRTDEAIAGEFGIRLMTVYRRRHELGIPSWQEQNPGDPEERRIRIRELPNTLTWEQWSFAVEFFGGRCAYCGESGRLFLTQDHLVPVSRDGPKTALNMIPACVSCNSSKHSLQAHKWIYQKFGMDQGQKIVKRIVAYLTVVKNNTEEKDVQIMARYDRGSQRALRRGQSDLGEGRGS